MIIWLVILLLVIILIYYNYVIVEHFDWKRNQCDYSMSENIQKVINELGGKESDKKLFDLYLPCAYNDIEGEIKMMNDLDGKPIIFILHNSDELTSKSAIWGNLVNYYGRGMAELIMPNGYRLNKDLDLFKKEYDDNKIYIMKKDIQRQEGLMITNDYNKILEGNKEGYVIVQELLQNPYLVDGRKINMRVYLLLVCENGKLDVYAHQNGFMYYTKVPFVKNSLNSDVNITTGYIDRSVYDKNPLTLVDFKNYLDNGERRLTMIEQRVMLNHKLSDFVFGRIYETISKLVDSVRDKLCENSKISQFKSFQLYGVDVALSDDLDVRIMEVNKGPDLGSKDDRDMHVKLSVIRDMFKVVGLAEGEDAFVRI